jgi:hypothetical protein
MIRSGYAAVEATMQEAIRNTRLQLTVAALSSNGLVYFRAAEDDAQVDIFRYLLQQ